MSLDQGEKKSFNREKSKEMKRYLDGFIAASLLLGHGDQEVKKFGLSEQREGAKGALRSPAWPP